MTDLARHWTLGYDLDGGGYEFSEPEEGTHFYGQPVLLWDDPDLDYILGSDMMRGSNDTADLLVVAPNSGHFTAYEFPKSFRDEDGDLWKRVAVGRLNATDHDCNCHGKFVEWTGGAGEPDKPEKTEQVVTWLQSVGDDVGDYVDDDIRENVLLDVDGEVKTVTLGVNWQYTGNTQNKPYFGCDRCDGDGYLDSPGGEWAIYARSYEDDDEE